MSDILRIWSQVLTPSELELSNQIAEPDLSRDISLKSGLRTPKSIIDKEIRAFHDISDSQKEKMVKTLAQLPDIKSSESDPQARPSEVSNLLTFSEQALVTLSHLDRQFLSHYASQAHDLSSSQAWDPTIDYKVA